MAQDSYPWTGSTVGDCGPYPASEEAEWNWLLDMTNMYEDGVLFSDGSFDGNFATTGSSSPITVASGRSCVRGRLHKSTVNEQFTISTPVGGSRQDLLILRSDYNAQTVRLAVKAGTVGGGDPTLTRTDGTMWEIPLYRITITTGGAITLTDLRKGCHFRTKVSTAMLDDGVLAATAEGRTKIAAGYFTTAERGKFANGFVNVDLIADGALTADAAGRAKMADGFITGPKLAAAIDAATSLDFRAARIYTRRPKRDWVRTDWNPSSYDDEFNDGTTDPKWTITGIFASAGEESSYRYSHYHIVFNATGSWCTLSEGYDPGSNPYVLSAMYDYGIRNTNAYYTLALLSNDGAEGVCAKYAKDMSSPSEWRLVLLTKTTGNWGIITYTNVPFNTHQALLIRRDGTNYEIGLSHNGYSFGGMGSVAKAFVAGKIECSFYYGDDDVQSRGECGLDYVRVGYDEL